MTKIIILLSILISCCAQAEITNKQFKVIFQNGIDATDYLAVNKMRLHLTEIGGVAIEDSLFELFES
jgi:hypothetical protein